MKYSLCIMAGAMAASLPVLAQNSAPSATPPDDLKVLDRELGVSGDFLYGNGYVQLPLGEALFRSDQKPEFGVGKLTTADRKSALYYGGTLSGSIGKTWYLDASYSRGTTEGALSDLTFLNIDRDLFNSQKLQSSYKLSDQYYQVYGKYAFPQFGGTRFAAYLRLGATFSENTANVEYAQPGKIEGAFKSSSNDYLGNIGLGGEYSVFRGDTFKVTTMLEAEAFGGIRKSSINESFNNVGVGFANNAATDLDTFVYGGLGRGVLRLVKTLDHEGQWKLNVDIGMQGKYWINEFDSLANGFDNYGNNRPNVHGTELLWGPYGRVGLSYSF